MRDERLQPMNYVKICSVSFILSSWCILGKLNFLIYKYKYIICARACNDSRGIKSVYVQYYEDNCDDDENEKKIHKASASQGESFNSLELLIFYGQQR